MVKKTDSTKKLLKDIGKKSYLLGLNITELTASKVKQGVGSHVKSLKVKISKDDAKKHVDKLLTHIEKNKGSYLRSLNKELSRFEKALESAARSVEKEVRSSTVKKSVKRSCGKKKTVGAVKKSATKKSSRKVSGSKSRKSSRK